MQRSDVNLLTDSLILQKSQFSIGLRRFWNYWPVCICDAIFRTWRFSTYPKKLSLITHGHVRKEDENEIETNHTFINWSHKLNRMK